MSIYPEHLNVFFKMSNVVPFTFPFTQPCPFLVVYPKTQIFCIFFLGYTNDSTRNEYPQS